jgi:hypothetical protein
MGGVLESRTEKMGQRPAGARGSQRLYRRGWPASPQIWSPEAKRLLAGAACNSCSQPRRRPFVVSQVGATVVGGMVAARRRSEATHAPSASSPWPEYYFFYECYGGHAAEVKDLTYLF